MILRTLLVARYSRKETRIMQKLACVHESASTNARELQQRAEHGGARSLAEGAEQKLGGVYRLLKSDILKPRQRERAASCFFLLKNVCYTRHPLDPESTRWSPAEHTLPDHKSTPAQSLGTHVPPRSQRRSGELRPSACATPPTRTHHPYGSRAAAAPTYAFKPEPHVFSSTILRHPHPTTTKPHARTPRPAACPRSASSPIGALGRCGSLSLPVNKVSTLGEEERERSYARAITHTRFFFSCVCMRVCVKTEACMLYTRPENSNGRWHAHSSHRHIPVAGTTHQARQSSWQSLPAPPCSPPSSCASTRWKCELR